MAAIMANASLVLATLLRVARRLRSIVSESWGSVANDRSDNYRPERHYMRGPGPKWRQKHGEGPARAEL
jgi:hypothetical protein